MKYSVVRGLIAFVLPVLLMFSAPAQADSDLVLEPIQVGPHSYYFQGQSGMASQDNKGYMSNAGFVITDDGVVVLDALGTPALGKAMVEAIGRVTDQPIKRIIVTHYHADHIYGLQELKRTGAEIWAHTKAQDYLNSEEALERLEQRRADLAPWVDEHTQLVPADRWLEFTDSEIMEFEMGGMQFQLIDGSGAHSPEDIMLYVVDDKVLFAGDLYFSGRIPYVSDADSKVWLRAIDYLMDFEPAVAVPGHGASSTNTAQDMLLTKEYLTYLRQEMGAAVEEMLDFEEAYENTDWSAYEDYPAFDDANRINAYGQFLRMERESLEAQ